jgi:hypothetical protein
VSTPVAVVAAPPTTPAAAAPSAAAPVTVATAAPRPRGAGETAAAPTPAPAAVATPTTAPRPVTTLRPNHAPVANDDTGLHATQGPPTVLAVKGNDSDPDGDALTYSIVRQPNGKPNVSAAGNEIKFVPNSGTAGAYTFVYRACDPSGLCDDAAATVSLSG